MAYINPEKEFYEKVYKKYERYGHASHGEEWISTILDENPSSWLDVGCGHNELIKECRENGYMEDVLGVDFACSGADQNCDMLDLPFEDKRWDFITAFDVMEHLLPEQVSAGLTEMSRVSKRFAFTISFVKALTQIDGKNAHPTVWPKEQWTKEIEKFGTIFKNHKGFFMGEWKGI